MEYLPLDVFDVLDRLDGEPPPAQLWVQARYGNVTAVEKLLRDSDEAAIDLVEARTGLSALDVAASQGHDEIVRLLLDAGATMGCALHSALCGGEVATAELLLERGADVRAVNVRGRTPLHYAVRASSSALVARLLAAGADVEARDKDGCTPLMYAVVSQPWIWLVRTSDVEAAFCMLLDHGSDVDAADNNGKTPLHAAAACPHVWLVEELIRRGADVDRRDLNGRTPLHCACSDGFSINSGSEDVVRALLEAGASVDVPVTKGNFEGWRPLHFLVCAQAPFDEEEEEPDWQRDQRKRQQSLTRRAILDLFLEHGDVDLDAVTAGDETAVMMAFASKDDAFGLALLDRGAKIGPPVCRTCIDAEERRVQLQALLVGVAAEAGRLERAREALAAAGASAVGGGGG